MTEITMNMLKHAFELGWKANSITADDLVADHKKNATPGGETMTYAQAVQYINGAMEADWQQFLLLYPMLTVPGTDQLEVVAEARAIKTTLSGMNWQNTRGGPYPYEPTLIFKRGNQTLRVHINGDIEE